MKMKRRLLIAPHLIKAMSSAQLPVDAEFLVRASFCKATGELNSLSMIERICDGESTAAHLLIGTWPNDDGKTLSFNAKLRVLATQQVEDACSPIDDAESDERSYVLITHMNSSQSQPTYLDSWRLKRDCFPLPAELLDNGSWMSGHGEVTVNIKTQKVESFSYYDDFDNSKFEAGRELRSTDSTITVTCLMQNESFCLGCVIQ